MLLRTWLRSWKSNYRACHRRMTSSRRMTRQAGFVAWQRSAFVESLEDRALLSPIGTEDLSITANSANKAEGNASTTAFTFTVTRTLGTAVTASVDYVVSGSGTHPADVTDFGGSFPSGTVEFGSGETSKEITISVTGDTSIEYDESFTVTLSNPSSGAEIQTASADGLIQNDDGSTFLISATDANKSEGNSGSTPFTFTVTRVGTLSSAATVDFAVAGSGTHAASSSDFAGGTLPSGTVNFEAEQSSQTITVNVKGDTTVEYTERFTATLSNASIGTISTPTANGFIALDDFVDMVHVASGSTVLVATIAENGHVQVKLGGVVQADVIPEAVRSIRLAGATGNDSIDLRGMSSSNYPNLRSIRLFGGAGNDTILGGEGDDGIFGGAGNDNLDGQGGNDQLKGGDGDDIIAGGAGSDTINGGNGQDSITGDDGNDLITGEDGDDTVSGGAGNDTVLGGDGNDVLSGNDDSDTVLGEDGDDVVNGGAAVDTLAGNLGNDTFPGASPAEIDETFQLPSSVLAQLQF